MVRPANRFSSPPAWVRLLAVALVCQVPFAGMWVAVLGDGFGNGWGAMGAAVYGTLSLGGGGAFVSMFINLIWGVHRGQSVTGSFVAALLAGFLAVIGDAAASFLILTAFPWHGC